MVEAMVRIELECGHDARVSVRGQIIGYIQYEYSETIKQLDSVNTMKQLYQHCNIV